MKTKTIEEEQQPTSILSPKTWVIGFQKSREAHTVASSKQTPMQNEQVDQVSTAMQVF